MDLAAGVDSERKDDMKPIRNTATSSRKANRGQSLSEYALLAALVALFSLAALAAVGGSIGNAISFMTNTFTGGGGSSSASPTSVPNTPNGSPPPPPRSTTHNTPLPDVGGDPASRGQDSGASNTGMDGGTRSTEGDASLVPAQPGTAPSGPGGDVTTLPAPSDDLSSQDKSLRGRPEVGGVLASDETLQ
jgi:Flp pilus assembly pilin Flp